MNFKNTVLILFFSILNPVSLSAQWDASIEDSAKKLCEDGKKLATENIKKGLYHVIQYGGKAPVQSDKYRQFRGYYFLYHYGVKVGYGGLVSSPFYDCYTSVMKDSVLALYGSDFFERVEKEVKKEFPNWILKEAQSEKIWDPIDSIHKIPFDIKKMEGYLEKEMDLKFANEILLRPKITLNIGKFP